MVRIDYLEHGKLPDPENIGHNIVEPLNTYRIETRLEAIIMLALFITEEEQYERATELLAVVLEHPKCPPVFYDKHQPITTLREKLVTALGQDDYQASYEGGKQADFEDIVAQIIEEYSPS